MNKNISETSSRINNNDSEIRIISSAVIRQHAGLSLLCYVHCYRRSSSYWVCTTMCELVTFLK